MPGLTPVDTIPEISREGKSFRLIQEFLDSGMDMALVEPQEVDDGEGGTKSDVGKAFGASLKRAIKQHDLAGQVEVANRQGSTYLRRVTS
jgi:hypothetical protein